MAPYSDVDLILLHEPNQEQRLTGLLRKFTQSIYDVGLELGFSSRTPADACAMAMKDISIFTSLAECRFLTGNEALYQRFWDRFQRRTRKRSRVLITEIIKARREERAQYGETNYLLEPHLKRSRGGLRDLQFIRWLGFARCGEVDPDNLVRAGLLSREDHQKTLAAREFLLRLRNELHFHSGKANDVLAKHEQVRIAELRGFKGSDGVLPVEQFMREYFRHTSEVRYTAANFAADASLHLGLWGLLEPLASYRIDGDFRIGPRGIRVIKRRLDDIAQNPAEILRLMDLANLSDCRIEHRTWSAIREAMMKCPSIEVTSLAAEKFMSLLSQPLHLGDLLRRLHELRVLEKLVPAVAHARCLLQFN
ncbi:MAG: Bifunctional uridylyltransferase/uridylyl-removing enzyme [Planctomycetota bacterium]